MLVEVNDQNFSETIKTNGLVVVDFYADWCVPCKYVEQALKEISENYNGNLKIAKVNVEKTTIASSFGVSTLPTLIFFKNGVPVANLIGGKTKTEIERLIEKYI